MKKQQNNLRKHRTSQWKSSKLIFFSVKIIFLIYFSQFNSFTDNSFTE